MLKISEIFGYYRKYPYICNVKSETMKLIDKIKQWFHSTKCKHSYELMYDERYDLANEKYYTYKLFKCKKCGKIIEVKE